MCNINGISAFILLAEALLIGAIASLTGASHNFLTPFGGSTGLLIATMVMLAAAMAVLATASTMLAGCSTVCAAQTASLKAAINALIGAMATQIGLIALVIALPATWFFVGSALVSALFAQFGALALLAAGLTRLAACASPRGSFLATAASSGGVVTSILSLAPVVFTVFHPRG